jgi:hypothetical protein
MWRQKDDYEKEGLVESFMSQSSAARHRSGGYLKTLKNSKLFPGIFSSLPVSGD